MVGRVETYIHSDSVTPNKGGALVNVQCQTDFAAKTSEFIAFSRLVARRAYGSEAASWRDIVNVFPEMENERVTLETTLKERINIIDISIMKM